MDTISWHAHEKIHTEKTPDWYWIVGIVTISIVVICIILNNIIFGILIFMSSFTLSLIASKKPRLVEIHADNEGISVGNIFYPYVNLDSFWVETRDAHHRVILKSKKLFMPYISILLEDMNPGQVRAYLGTHLHEEEHIEPLFEKILIYLGF